MYLQCRMSVLSNKKAIAWKELSAVFKLQPTSRHWSIPVLAALCVGIPLLIGYYFNQFASALTASLAGLVILYMPIHSNLVGTLAKLLICSFGFLVSYGVGITFSFNPIISCIVFGIYSALIHWSVLVSRMKPPGNFFFILLAAMASGIPFRPETIPERIGLLTIGSILTCFLAITFSLFIQKPDIIKETRSILNQVHFRKDADYLESFIVGFFMFSALLTGYLSGMDKPYWIPISCLAVMQGSSTLHIWRRGFYRIIGTVLGMGLCWIILSLFKNQLEICITIIVLQFIIEAIITRNYTIAVIFITPMTILLSEAASPIAQNPTTLITSRLIDVLIGSMLGALGGWMLYHEQLRFRVVKRIRVTRLAIKKRS